MDNTDKKALGERIKSIRLDKGMTLEEFGKLFGASKSSVLGWEKGRNAPNKERLVAISKIAGITVKELLQGPSDYFSRNDEYELYRDTSVLFWLVDCEIDFFVLETIDIFLKKEEKDYSFPYASLPNTRSAFYLYLEKEQIQVNAGTNLEEHFKTFLSSRIPSINKVLSPKDGPNEEFWRNITLIHWQLYSYFQKRNYV